MQFLERLLCLISLLSSRKQSSGHVAAAIPQGIRPVPPDPGSQALPGPPSTGVGDNLGTVGAAAFLLSTNFQLPWCTHRPKGTKVGAGRGIRYATIGFFLNRQCVILQASSATALLPSNLAVANFWNPARGLYLLVQPPYADAMANLWDLIVPPNTRFCRSCAMGTRGFGELLPVKNAGRVGPRGPHSST